MKCRTVGPTNAKILIVGEAPGWNEEKTGLPFCGASGEELGRMLREAGISQHDCRVTNTVPWRPPQNKIDLWFYNKTQAMKVGCEELCGKYPNSTVLLGIEELQREINSLKPEIILALGNTALWALTGCIGVAKWRGSMFEAEKIIAPVKYSNINPCIIATYHPAAIMRQWHLRYITVQDIRRVPQVLEYSDRKKLLNPEHNFYISPGYSLVMDYLNNWMLIADKQELFLSVDIETRGGFIACLGLGSSEKEALCIPFMSTENPDGYWLKREEIDICYKLYQLFSHKNVRIIGQNFLFDAQYLVRYLYFWPKVSADTMIMQGVAWPSMSKGLAFIASMYCDYYLYWKDDGKLWNPKYQDETQLWHYNCLDVVYTFKVWNELSAVIKKRKLTAPLKFVISMFDPVLVTMLRGVRIDLKRRAELALEIVGRRAEYEAFFEEVIGSRVGASKKAKPWYSSPKQTATLFYEEIGLKPILHKTTKRPTTDDGALTKIGEENAILLPLCNALAHYRSFGVYYNNFICAKLESNRIRCYYNLVGTETFRLSSSKDAFGYGTNLQNIPRDQEH